MEQYKAAWQIIVPAMDAALYQMQTTVPQPQLVRIPTGYGYRFVERTTEQAIVIKCVRLLSALKALHLLLTNGLTLDAGATMRVMDEVYTDIMFLAGPSVTGQPMEERHKTYLTELFQEEFEGPDVMNSKAKRHRVGRKHIRAYVARAYSNKADVEKHVVVQELIEQTFSGFVHGSGVHTMDAFDGYLFAAPSSADHPPLLSVVDQFGHYFQRSLIAFCHAGHALGRPDVFDILYRLNAKTFDEYGELLKPSAEKHPQT